MTLKPEIIQTILHFTDDKKWTHEKIIEGDNMFGYTFRIPKFPSYKDCPLVALPDEVPPMILNRDYEFDFIKERIERFSKNYYIKHLYYEMR